jgi:hypothetical protein
MQDDIPEELRRLIQKEVDKYNNMPHPDFEGYSPKAMAFLIHDPFNAESPVWFNKLSADDLEKVPLFRQVYYLASLINEMKEIKLTATGKLTIKIINDILSRKFIKLKMPAPPLLKKQYREDDIHSIGLTRILLEICGVTKKSSKKLELSRKGKKLLTDKQEFFRVMFENYTTKFNWAYGDYFGNEAIGQLAWLFSVSLVAKYGNKFRTFEFYSEKYFKAFPMLLEDQYSLTLSHISYSHRFLERFMHYMGLVEIDYPDDYHDSPKIKKSPLFGKFVRVRF